MSDSHKLQDKIELWLLFFRQSGFTVKKIIYAISSSSDSSLSFKNSLFDKKPLFSDGRSRYLIRIELLLTKTFDLNYMNCSE